MSGKIKQQGDIKPARKAPDKVKATPGQMARGLAKSAAQAFTNGRVSPVVRKERYDTCQACPAFMPDEKRCSDCGCYMAAKTWIGGSPEKLCPRNKWAR